MLPLHFHTGSDIGSRGYGSVWAFSRILFCTVNKILTHFYPNIVKKGIWNDLIWNLKKNDYLNKILPLLDSVSIRFCYNIPT
jgi:hypothetical protein